MSPTTSTKWKTTRRQHRDAKRKVSRSNTSTLDSPFTTRATILAAFPHADGIAMTTPTRKRILLFCSPTRSANQQEHKHDGKIRGEHEVVEISDKADSGQKAKSNTIVSHCSCCIWSVVGLTHTLEPLYWYNPSVHSTWQRDHRCPNGTRIQYMDWLPLRLM